MKSKILIALLVVSFQFFEIGISAQTASKNASTELYFPTPKSLHFKSNEIAEIESIISLYTPSKNFQADIIRFLKEDSIKNQMQFNVVFTGSSSFTKWKSLPEDMAPIPVLNRGFGGSKIMDMVYFSNSYLYKLQPKLIFVYVENDITLPKVATIKLLFSYLERVYHSKLPKTKIVFCGIKKSALRRAHWSKVDEVNTFLASKLSKRKNCGYLDMNTPLLDVNGLPRGEFFLADSLHVNAKGYAKWIEVVKPRLQKEYSLITR